MVDQSGRRVPTVGSGVDPHVVGTAVDPVTYQDSVDIDNGGSQAQRPCSQECFLNVALAEEAARNARGHCTVHSPIAVST